jgi:hypothetical protein
MSLTKASFSMITGAPVNVLDYGAVNDSVTNNDAAFTSALAVNGSAYVPDGGYVLSLSFDISRLWGPGLIYKLGIAYQLPASYWRASKNNCNPLVVDMHYGILRGTCWTAGEAGVVTAFPITSSIAAGATSITTTGTPPVDGQLVTYLSTDGQQYANVVTSVVGSTFTIDSPVIGGIAAGNNVTTFYYNAPHPNTYGYKAITDYATRNPLRSYKNMAFYDPVSLYTGAVTRASGNNVIKPGGGSFPGWNINAAASGQGCSFSFVVNETGAHLLRLKINTLGNAVYLNVYTTVLGGAVQYYGGPITTDAATLVEIPIWSQRSADNLNTFVAQSLQVELTSTVVGASVFYIQRADFSEYDEVTANNLNWGKHVCFGDSWFAQDYPPSAPGIVSYLQEKYQNAIFVNKGFGGYNAQGLVGLFDTEVAPQNPDFVWIIVGTNDYSSSTSADVEAFYVQQLKLKCQQIGATPIFFTPSVGDITVGSNFDYSRQYADLIPYIDQDLQNQTGTWTPTPTGLTTTGSPIITGTYTRVGNLVYAWVRIDANGGSSSSTAATTYFSNLPFTPKQYAVCMASNETIANLGTGLVGTDKKVYPPTWGVTGGITTVSCVYCCN